MYVISNGCSRSQRLQVWVQRYWHSKRRRAACFAYHSGLYISGFVRPTTTSVPVMERTLCYKQQCCEASSLLPVHVIAARHNSFSSYLVADYCTLHYCTLHYCTLHYCTLHYCTLHYCALQYCILHYCTLHYCILHYCTLHYCTLHYFILHYCTLHYCTLHYCILH